ncbi:hypothetical protein SAZ11_15490 [Streptomyces sp. FXJ1.4098]|nr:hypothetical protein [Streptomyces sp. FXJ1.4098]
MAVGVRPVVASGVAEGGAAGMSCGDRSSGSIPVSWSAMASDSVRGLGVALAGAGLVAWPVAPSPGTPVPCGRPLVSGVPLVSSTIGSGSGSGSSVRSGVSSRVPSNPVSSVLSRPRGGANGVVEGSWRE